MGPCDFVISPCFEKFPDDFSWRVKLLEKLEVELEGSFVYFRGNMLPLHRSRDIRMNTSF
jgi:hypothetical protein